MDIQNIQSISQNVEKTYGMLNELGNNGVELMDLAFPNHDAIQDSLEYEIIKYGYRYIDNGDGTFDVCYDHSQDSYFNEYSLHHVARVREDENTYYIKGDGDSCEGEYYKNDWTFADALINQCGVF